MNKGLTAILAVVLIIVVVCAVSLGVLLNSSYSKIKGTQVQLSNTQTQLASTQAQLSSTQAQLAGTQSQLTNAQQQLATLQASINVIDFPTAGNGAGYKTTPSLLMGIPMIKPGDEIYIYGAGFSVGENITFQISDYFGSFHLGSYTVVNNAGIFSWQIEANWSNYNWQPNGSILSCITAKGDKGSKAIAIVEIGTE